MTTTITADLATSPDPYPAYAALVRDRPLAHDPGTGSWIAADAASVRAVLTDPGARVRPPEQPVPAGVAGGPAGVVFGRLARMTDGAAHDRARRPLDPALAGPDPAEPARSAARLARRRLDGPVAGLFTDLMHDVPVRAVAELLGLPDPAGARQAVTGFVRCIPPTAGPEDHAAADAGAEYLLGAVGSTLRDPHTGLARDLSGRTGSADGGAADGGADPVRVANVIGLLNQTLEATAGLVGNTLLALRREGDDVLVHGLDAVVAEVARHDPPIQNTRRFTVAPVTVGGTVVPAGASILVLLAAAGRDPAVNPDPAEFRPDRSDPVTFTFGAGGHRCPGRSWAVRIAAAVVGEVLAGRPVATALAALPDEVAYRPLPNARIPELDPVAAVPA